MNELSLFTGIGGSLLAGKILGWRPIGAIEIEPYPCAVLRERQLDGQLPEFPVWCMDIGEFNRRIAPAYTGLVDVLTAGFPCKPWSTAARGRNVEKSLWPETLEAIRISRPRRVFLENVSKLPLLGAKTNLESGGFCCHGPLGLSASHVGAIHIRKRFWLFAHADNESEQQCRKHDEMAGSPENEKTFWEDYPGDLGMDDGIPDRVDRLKGLGNAWVPQQAVEAWRILTRPQGQEKERK